MASTAGALSTPFAGGGGQPDLGSTAGGVGASKRKRDMSTRLSSLLLDDSFDAGAPLVPSPCLLLAAADPLHLAARHTAAVLARPPPPAPRPATPLPSYKHRCSSSHQPPPSRFSPAPAAASPFFLPAALPHSPSMDTFLNLATTCLNGQTMLPGRLYSSSAGRSLSGMGSLDLNWLFAEGGAGAGTGPSASGMLLEPAAAGRLLGDGEFNGAYAACKGAIGRGDGSGGLRTAGLPWKPLGRCYGHAMASSRHW